MRRWGMHRLWRQTLMGKVLLSLGIAASGAAAFLVGASVVWRFLEPPGVATAPGSVPAALGLAIVGLVLWIVPQWQVARIAPTVAEPKERLQLENQLRTTLAQIAGGFGLLVGLMATWQGLLTTQEGQITDRFTRATEQLGSVTENKPRMEVRVGGIYALERIARDSARDHAAVMALLTTYLRVVSPLTDPADEAKFAELLGKYPAEDVQAAIRVLARRELRHEQTGDRLLLDLTIVDLHGIDLRGRANLDDAIFNNTDLRLAHLEGASLRCAELYSAHLDGAYLVGADMTGVSLMKAHLNGAILAYAKLEDASLLRAELKGADLTGVDLRRVRGLTREQVNSAASVLNEDLLPADLPATSPWPDDRGDGPWQPGARCVPTR
jgi:uncharacterized protein YjbI with pentapeptide repeats